VRDRHAPLPTLTPNCLPQTNRFFRRPADPIEQNGFRGDHSGKPNWKRSAPASETM